MTIRQYASKYQDETPITFSSTNNSYIELSLFQTGDSSSCSTVYDFKKFVESAKENNGYYYARYEASCGSDGKAKSKYKSRPLGKNISGKCS